MKIVFVSNHNPHFVNTNVYREKAIKELGHKLIFFEDRDFVIPGRIRQKINSLQEWDTRRLNKKLVKLLSNEKPDLCMVVGGYRVLPETLSEIRKMAIIIILWTTDPPRNFTPIIKTAPFYDYIFCSGTEAVEILKKEGLKRVSWLPFACEPDYHRPVELTEEDRKRYTKDIVFVGSFYPNRARILEAISDLDIGVWGPYWSKLDKNSPLKKKAVDAKLNYDEWIKIYSAAKIVLVIHYDDGKTPCNQASPKLYEALACRSFVLIDNSKDARALFEDKKHVVFFNDEKDLREKIMYYSDRIDEREKIASEGYKEVLAKHTYRHRIEEMLNIIKTGNPEIKRELNESRR